MGRKAFRRAFKAAVRAEVERRELARQLSQPISFSTMTIDFTNRTVDYRGRLITCEMPMMTIPLLNTEQAVFVHDMAQRGLNDRNVA